MMSRLLASVVLGMALLAFGSSAGHAAAFERSASDCASRAALEGRLIGFADRALAIAQPGPRSWLGLAAAVLEPGCDGDRLGITELQLLRVSERIEIHALRRERSLSVVKHLSEVYGEEAVPTDAWGNALVFEPGSTPVGYDIVALGSDGRAGGCGVAADVRYSDVAGGVR